VNVDYRGKTFTFKRAQPADTVARETVENG
jgi:hypothetical protein